MAFTFLIFLAVGFLLGSIRRWSDKIIAVNGKLQTIGVIALIFTMGLSIGANKTLVAKFSQMGLKAFVFALLSVFFSVFLIWIFYSLKGGKSR